MRCDILEGFSGESFFSTFNCLDWKNLTPLSSSVAPRLAVKVAAVRLLVAPAFIAGF